MTQLQIAYDYVFETALPLREATRILREQIRRFFPPDLGAKFLFSHGGDNDNEGEPGALPRFVMTGYKNTVSVIATGDEMGALLDRYAVQLRLVLEDALGERCFAKRTVTLQRFELVEEPVDYVMHRFTSRSKVNRRQRLHQLPPDERPLALAELVDRYLLKQIRLLQPSIAGLTDLVIRDSIELEDVIVPDESGPRAQRSSNEILIKRARFTMRANLEGYWAAGGQMSRGQGRIMKSSTA